MICSGHRRIDCWSKELRRLLLGNVKVTSSENMEDCTEELLAAEDTGSIRGPGTKLQLRRLDVTCVVCDGLFEKRIFERSLYSLLSIFQDTYGSMLCLDMDCNYILCNCCYAPRIKFQRTLLNLCGRGPKALFRLQCQQKFIQEECQVRCAGFDGSVRSLFLRRLQHSALGHETLPDSPDTT